MKTGNCIRNAFNLYLENPLIIVPFALLGILTSVPTLFLTSYFRDLLTLESKTFFQTFLFRTLAENIFQSILRYIILFSIALVILVFVSSFVNAFSIGLVKKMSENKGAKLKHGLSTIKRGFQVFFANIIISLLIIAGFAIIFIPSIVLFETIGILIAIIFLLVYIALISIITFFAAQSIVLENKSPWAGIVSSYKFIKKNLENFALLVIFIIFATVCFTILQKVGIHVGQFFLSLTVMDFFATGLHFLLFSLLLNPYLMVLKTYFFIKNS